MTLHQLVFAVTFLLVSLGNVSNSSDCPPSWVAHNGSCYVLTSKPKSTQCGPACNAIGATPACPRNWATANFLGKTFPTPDGFGCSDSSVEEQQKKEAAWPGTTGGISREMGWGYDGCVFLGVMRNKDEKTNWTCNGEPYSFRHWASEQPNNKLKLGQTNRGGPTDELCVALHVDGDPSSHWYDFSCHNAGGCICEKSYEGCSNGGCDQPVAMTTE